MAVIGLTSTLAFEVGPAGVNVNSLSPGPVDGAADGPQLPARGRADRRVRTSRPMETFVSRAALGRMVTEEEVGRGRGGHAGHARAVRRRHRPVGRHGRADAAIAEERAWPPASSCSGCCCGCRPRSWSRWSAVSGFDFVADRLRARPGRPGRRCGSTSPPAAAARRTAVLVRVGSARAGAGPAGARPRAPTGSSRRTSTPPSRPRALVGVRALPAAGPARLRHLLPGRALRAGRAAGAPRLGRAPHPGVRA